MKINKIPLFSLVFLLLVSGCSHNIDSMIENYNSKIPVEEKYYFVDNPGPGEPGFIPEDMLEEKYYVTEKYIGTAVFQISAPSKGRNPKWTVQEFQSDGEYVTMTDIKFPESYGYNSHTFCIYIPDSGLKGGHSYLLTLVVQDKLGIKYTDSCGLIIERPFKP